MSDTDWLGEILGMLGSDGWISHTTILERAQHELGHGITVHSRAADLRKRGYDVECRIETHNGRKVSSYRIRRGLPCPSSPAASASRPGAGNDGSSRSDWANGGRDEPAPERLFSVPNKPVHS